MGRTIKSIALRFVLPLAVFALILLVSAAFRRVFGFNIDLTILLIALLIATAWYMGRAPGIFIALVFETVIIIYSPPLPTGRTVFVTINRLALFISIVIFASSRRAAEREREKLLESERAARREAEIAGRFKDEFLATVSHELRTPLSAIQGWALMLKKGHLKIEDAPNAFEVIERNARLQGEIINDLLDVSQITTGKLTIENKPVEIVSLLETTVESLQPQAEVKAVEMTFSTAEREAVICGDDLRLRQIVLNLLSNALKFTPENGKIEIRAEKRDQKIEITVSDTGVGIAANFLPFVFDKFRQGDGSMTRPHGGLGLGLSIVRHLVKLHGGEIHAASDGEGRGATFKVGLPLAEYQRAAAAAGAENLS